jgi:hypothetical protein
LRTPGTYSATYLVEPTPYRKGEIEKHSLAQELAEQQWYTLPLETLRQIAALLRNDGRLQHAGNQLDEREAGV